VVNRGKYLIRLAIAKTQLEYMKGHPEKYPDTSSVANSISLLETIVLDYNERITVLKAVLELPKD
jgi:hypothetical protein